MPCEDPDTEGRQPCEDRDRDWRYAATRNCKRKERGNTLISKLWPPKLGL